MYHRSFGKYASIIVRHQRIILDHAFKQLGFSTGTYGFFLAVAENEGATQKELSVGMQTTKGTTNKALKKLEEEGFVKTIIDDQDRRLHKVYLTDRGRQVSPQVYDILKTYSFDLSECLTEEEREITFNALIKMAERAKEMVDDIREDNHG
jgi:DNA-binding MarR family transcriptional regulator